ncbi:GNAT family N-acetyltransferase [Candidatus Sumerlaeota bacterium]|nr:GNAT family N-acetyltransferase [Candidatus Sumerlaeota bacterium]
MSDKRSSYIDTAELQWITLETEADTPPWIARDDLAAFFNVNLHPYEDRIEDIQKGLDYAFSSSEGKGGFVLLAVQNERILGGLVMLNTGMEGYVPGHLLLFVGVLPEFRGKGIGRLAIERALMRVKGDVKLHVEYDNPAKRLYERIGFENKYAEMRLHRGKGNP